MSEIDIAVKSNSRSSEFCPVSVNIDVSPNTVRDRALYDQQKGVTVPYQVTPADGTSGCVIHWIMDSMAAHQRREFTLTKREDSPEGSTVDLAEQDDKIQVTIGAEHFTNYHYGDDVPRPVLYPIIGPYGHGVTRAYPMEIVENDHTDHPHHRSVWVAWGDVNGSDVWSEEDNSGRVEHRQFESYGSGPVFGWIKSTNDWLDSSGAKLMEEHSTYRFFNLPGNCRLLEMKITLQASDGDVCLGDTKEGGICSVRVAAPMEVDRGGCIENAFGGVNEPETWGKRAPWCDYSGVVDGDEVGIAILDHPDNFRHPTYWHVRNYGLMTANPFGLSHFLDSQDANGSYTMPLGESLTFRYAVYVHAGDAEQGGVRERYLDWIYPPKAWVIGQ